MQPSSSVFDPKICWLLSSKLFMVVLPSAGTLDCTGSKSFVLLLELVQVATVWRGGFISKVILPKTWNFGSLIFVSESFIR